MSDEEFKKAVTFVNNPTQQGPDPSNETKLKFYALFKQATQGPPKGSAPSRLRVVERAKYMAWKEVERLSQDQARAEYIKTLSRSNPQFSKL